LVERERIKEEEWLENVCPYVPDETVAAVSRANEKEEEEEGKEKEEEERGGEREGRGEIDRERERKECVQCLALSDGRVLSGETAQR